MRHDIDLIKKTAMVFAFLAVAFFGFETLKHSSYTYQKEELLAHLKEFSNLYIKDENDKKQFESCIEKIKEIADKYNNRKGK